MTDKTKPFIFTAIGDLPQPATYCKNPMIEISADKKWLTVKWGGQDYEIDMLSITQPEDILWWILIMVEKEWKNTTPERIACFIEAACRANGWPTHEPITNEIIFTLRNHTAR